MIRHTKTTVWRITRYGVLHAFDRGSRPLSLCGVARRAETVLAAVDEGRACSACMSGRDAWAAAGKNAADLMDVAADLDDPTGTDG